MCEKDYSWNPSICACDNSKYLESIIDDSVVIRDEIIEVAKTIPSKVTKNIPTKTVITKTISTKTIPTDFNKERVICKIENVYI